MGLLQNSPMEHGERVQRGWDHGFRTLLKLGRMKMTVFSAVTYGAGASVANLRELDSGLFLWGWAFVFFTQMVAHLLGEYYDLPSDRLNIHSGPLTGGSKVLVTGDVTPRQCLALGYASLCVSLTILVGVLPSQCWPLGFGLVVIAHQYSSVPFRVNHRGLGEVVAAIATNVLLPPFAALVQPSASPLLGSSMSFYGCFALLVVPAFFVKVATFLILNVADRRADWLGGKYTLPVLIGDKATERCVRDVSARLIRTSHAVLLG